MLTKPNSELYPEAWEIFVEYARNIENEPDISHLGKYRISHPDMSGSFIYAYHPGQLFVLFKDAFYKQYPDMPSQVYRTIQYIVENF